MKAKFLKALLLAAVSSVFLERAGAQALDLSQWTTNTTGVYTNTFDSMGSTTSQTNGTGGSGYLSGEWTCFTGATANGYGTVASGAPNVSSPGTINNWTNPFNGGFFNYASYFDYLGGTNFYTNNALTNTLPLYGVILDPDYQTNEPNRALGIRQIGAFGDPGAAFVIKLQDTSLYDNFRLSFDWMNLDPTSPRQTTWLVQYGIADTEVGVPAAFQTFAGGTLKNNPGSFHWNRVTLPLGNGTINNIASPGGAPAVWLRIVTLSPSSGSGNRETFAIDNFGLSWSVGSAGCTPVSVPTITPPNAPVYSNATVAFTVSVSGTQPIYYQWRYNGQNVEQVFPSQVAGFSYRSSILTLQNVTANNQGNFDCVVSNACGSTVYTNVSSTAAFALTTVPAVSLGYLRTLTDSTYTPTPPQSQLYQVTGIITTLTNLTSGNTASYYIQDATGGMNLFVTGGAGFRPQIGDEVTTVGYLNLFQGNLELEADLTGSGNNATSVQDLSNNIANYPVPKLLDWPTEFADGVTNSTVEKGTTNGAGQIIVQSKKGSICMLTNVYFGTNAGHVITGNYYTYVTNANGLAGWVYFWGSQDHDLVGHVIPDFAYSVQGPLFANIVTPPGSFWSGIAVTKWSDVVTQPPNPPNPLVVSITRSGTGSTISWNAVPISTPPSQYITTNSVLAATNLEGPYSPLATGLQFTTTPISYTDLDTNSAQKFYRVTSP
jgi:hypothetical protein